MLIAVLISTAADAAWEARIRLWVADGRPPDEYAALLFDPELIDAATSSVMSSESGPAQLSGLSVELRDTLIILSVRAGQANDAEHLALSIAATAADEAAIQFGRPGGLRVLGLAQPEARQSAPRTERNGAIAAAVGLIVGFALATALAQPARAAAASSSLGRIGRVGLRTIAVLPRHDCEQTNQQGEPPSSARQLADALDTDDRSAVSVTAFIPLDSSVSAFEAATQSARALAGRDQAVLWLDARASAFQLELSAPPPHWLEGPNWSAIPRSELIRRALEAYRRQLQQVIVLGPELVDPDALMLVGLCDRVVLVASADTPVAELATARTRLRGTKLLGVAVTDAAANDTQAFTLAQATD